MKYGVFDRKKQRQREKARRGFGETKKEKTNILRQK